MSELRIAVIGAGHLGRIHAKLLGQVEGAKLVALSDPCDAARQQATKQFSVPAFADYRDLIPQIDAAVVAAPTDRHAKIAEDLLSAGKHVLVEKPMTTCRDDARRLALIAATRRLTLQVGHVERFNPAFAALDDLAVDVKYADAVRASSFPGRCLDVGVVMDLMIHDLDLVLSLTTAPVTAVAASGIAVVSNHEDMAEARIEFGCGLVANLKASRISPAPARRMHLFGSNGFAALDFSAPALTVIRPSDAIVHRSFDLTCETDHPLGYADQLFSSHLPSHTRPLETRNAILDELHDFVISVQTGVPPTVDAAAGVRAVELAQRILETIQERTWYESPRSVEIGPHAIVRQRIEHASRRRAA